MRAKVIWKQKGVFIIYTFGYAIACSLIFCCFHLQGKTLICSGDAYIQGLPGVVKEIEYLKDILRNIFLNHRLEIPLVDYEIGFGMDTVVNLFHYPLVVLGIFCPQKYYAVFYQMVPFALLYLAGIAFLVFCGKVNFKKNDAVLMGCMVYLFEGYALFSVTRYIVFVYPLVYLPLCLSGVEDVLRRKKAGLLIISTAFLFTASWYFGYMVSVFVVLYCFLRLFPMLHKKYVSLFLKQGLWLAGTYLLGIMLSGVWLLPAIYGYLNSCRVDGNTDNVGSLWHYGISYYQQFLSGFLVPGTDSFYEMFTGFLPIVFPALMILFVLVKSRRYRIWKCLFLFLLLFAVCPIFGKMMNGGGYVSNRWCFCLAFTLGVIVTAAFSVWTQLDPTRIRMFGVLTLAATGVYLFFAILGQETDIWISVCILFGYACIFLSYPCADTSDQKIQKMVLGVTAFSAVLFLAVNFHSSFSSYCDRFLDHDGVFGNTYLAGAGEIADDDFYRIGTPWNETNLSMYYGFRGTSVYTNLVDKNAAMFFGELAMNTRRYAFQLTGMDERAVLNDLFAVKYHVSSSDTLPYGFVHYIKDETGNQAVAKNVVSPVRFYDTCMEKENYMQLEPLQRQEALHQTVISEEKIESLKTAQYVDHYTDLPYRITDLHNITFEGNTVNINDMDARMTIAFDPVENAEIYLDIKGLELLSDQNILTVYTGAGQQGNRFLILNQDFPYYVDDNVTVNLGYSQKGFGTCTFAFSGPGRFRFDSMKVLSFPMEAYESYREGRQENGTYDFQIGNNQFTCSLDIMDRKLVQFCIPYSIGWNAYIDGEKTKIYQTDTMFMSVLAEPGAHEIRFVYCTPFLRTGMAISGMALLILLYLYVSDKKRCKGVRRAKWRRYRM